MSNANVTNSRITGPTPLPRSSMAYINQQMVSHRSASFKATYGNVQTGLQALLNTTCTPLLFTSSGTAAMESTVDNLLGPSDRALTLSCGYYGDLFHRMVAMKLGHNAHLLRAEEGHSIDRSHLKKALISQPYKAIFLTHNESSTGVTNPLKEMVALIRQHSDALIIVDSISGLGGLSIPFDAWDLDVLIGVTQKGLMSPPGMSIVVVNDRALDESRQQRNFGSVAFNYPKAHALALERQTLTTPSLHAFWGLEHALATMADIGFEHVFQHHRDIAHLSRTLAKQNGFTLFSQPHCHSDTITALEMDAGILASDIAARLSSKHGIAVGVGNGKFTDSVLRIAHMGYVSDQDIHDVYSSLSDMMKSDALPFSSPLLR
ncbi:pyridoxal-phosphate-dependent aminotransferase family protein [Vibrio hyugaensis]|uniref:pyridoxal-phosphate-dependent aminotransferase family protein n=1 Tax=Vibrio hyugaensis TaxID=1534743 RepID=UPI0005EFE644|nr:aminotransferase class V-fold PLP-dependent enzyme [Vibrio hyugaensis]